MFIGPTQKNFCSLRNQSARTVFCGRTLIEQTYEAATLFAPSLRRATYGGFGRATPPILTICVKNSNSIDPPPERTDHEHFHHQRWHTDLLQRLGQGSADRFQPWLAAYRGRVRRSDVLSRLAWLSRYCP